MSILVSIYLPISLYPSRSLLPRSRSHPTLFPFPELSLSWTLEIGLVAREPLQQWHKPWNSASMETAYRVAWSVHQVAVHLFIRSRFIYLSGRGSSVHQAAKQLFIRPPSNCSSSRWATVHQAALLLFIRLACYCFSDPRATINTVRRATVIEAGVLLFIRPLVDFGKGQWCIKFVTSLHMDE
jgi:hypothetical protein